MTAKPVPPLQEVACNYGRELNKRLQCFKFLVPAATTGPYNISNGSVDGFKHGAEAPGFSLPVVVLKSKLGVHPEPIVYLAGGPGSMFISGEYSVRQWLEWLDESSVGRDLVLYDIRGASPGEPHWDCDAYTDVSKKFLQRNLSSQEESRQVAPILFDCLERWDHYLQKQFRPRQPYRVGAGVGLFSTSHHVADLKNLMTALGFDRWSILSDSYGTRLAMAAAAVLPSQIEAMILDSPYPLGRGALDDSLVVWHNAFERLFLKYESQQLKQNYEALAQQLSTKALTVTVENWATGEQVAWVLNDVRLASVIYTAMYLSEFHADIPLAIAGLLQGNVSNAQMLLELFYNNAFSEEFNAMIYIATECNDNSSVSKSEYESALNIAKPWAKYFGLDWQFDICRTSFFNSNPLQKQSWKQSTLIASGELDPITDSGYASDTLHSAKNGWIISLPNRAHAEFIFSDCGAALIPWFLNATAEQRNLEWSQKKQVCLSLIKNSEAY